MRKLLAILFLTIPTLLFGQENKLDFNYSFHGNYNPTTDDYSNNMVIDSMANTSVYINLDRTKLIVTYKNDTLFNHQIYNVEHEEDGMITYNTTNYFNEAVFMYHADNGITMLYGWVDQTEQVKMHYKFKYFWGNR